MNLNITDLIKKYKKMFMETTLLKLDFQENIINFIQLIIKKIAVILILRKIISNKVYNLY